VIGLVLANGWDGVPPAEAGPLGLLVILVLAVACVFLFRSMNRQLRKVPESFDPPEEPVSSADGRGDPEP
jgi:hypothetical protein